VRTTGGQGLGARVLGAAESGGQPVLLPERFEHFYEREYAGLVRLALVLSGSRYAAEDIAQDALLAAWRDWRRIDQPLAWTRRVVANLAASSVRRRLIEARALARVAARRQVLVAELPAEPAAFWAAVRTLPKRQAQAVALYYLEDLPVAEIAATLGTAEGTVRASLHKARAALARRLQVDGGEEQR
jgi:RNA polymerase sigma-70 factor, ECF subfamily